MFFANSSMFERCYYYYLVGVKAFIACAFRFASIDAEIKVKFNVTALSGPESASKRRESSVCIRVIMMRLQWIEVDPAGGRRLPLSMPAALPRPHATSNS